MSREPPERARIAALAPEPAARPIRFAPLRPPRPAKPSSAAWPRAFRGPGQGRLTNRVWRQEEAETRCRRCPDSGRFPASRLGKWFARRPCGPGPSPDRTSSQRRRAEWRERRRSRGVVCSRRANRLRTSFQLLTQGSRARNLSCGEAGGKNLPRPSGSPPLSRRGCNIFALPPFGLPVASRTAWIL